MMGRIKVLLEGKILKDGLSTALLLAAVGRLRKKAMSPEMSTRCIHLACKHNADCARLLLKGGHGITASPLGAKDQLTLQLLHVVARAHSARYIIDPENALQGTHSVDTNFWLLHGSPLALVLLMSPMSKRVQVISSLEKSTGDLLPYLPDHKAVRLLPEKTKETWEEASEDAEGCATALAMLVVIEDKISAQARNGGRGH